MRIRRLVGLLALLVALAFPATTSAATCGNEAIRAAQHAEHLPDCRAYEMVSPPQKNSATILRATMLPHGEMLVGASESMLPTDPFNGFESQYLAARGGTGWGLRYFAMPGIDADPEAILPDGSAIFYGGYPGLPTDEFDHYWADLYRVDGGAPILLSTGTLGNDEPFDSRYMGSSSDGSHVIFQTFEHLEPEDADRVSGPMLYEHFDGRTRMVALGTDGLPLSDAGAVAAGSVVTEFGALFVDDKQGRISADGSRIFFEAPAPAEGVDSRLYLREDGETTTEISASQRSVPPTVTGSAAYEIASRDGSIVYFRTRGQLTDDDSDDYVDLYRFEVGTGELSRVSAGVEFQDRQECVGDGDGYFGVCGAVEISDDGQRVYYLAGIEIDGFPDGGFGIFLYDARDGSTTVVAKMPQPIDVPRAYQLLYNTIEGRALDTAEAAIDGSVLVFAANYPLTGFDSTSPACDDWPADRCTELYRYDAEADQLTCLSCNPWGTVPLGSADVPYGGYHFARSRTYISDDGGTVAFATDDRLLAIDVNGRADVYRWRDGDLSLISDGVGPAADLTGIDASGATVAFRTRAQLTGVDRDRLTDLYVAREGGGFPEPAPPPFCSGESCQSYPGPPLVLAAPATDAPAPRNSARKPERRCRGPRVRRAVRSKGRCLRTKGKRGGRRR